MKRKPNRVDFRAVAAIANAWMAFSRAWLSDAWWRRLLEHLERRDLSRAVESVPDPTDIEPERFEALHQLVLNAMATVYEDSANREYARVGSTMRATLRKASKKPNRFIEVPHSDTFIRERAARLVVEVSRVQRQQIRDSIMRRYRADVRPEALVRDIKATVGLDTRLTNAVQNRAAELRLQGMKAERVLAETEKYSDQLLRYRAEMIARTETAAVDTDAKQTAWSIAADEGIVDRPMQEWVANSGACPECQDMDGQTVLVGELFHSNDFGFVKGPTLHPHCVLADALVSAPAVHAATKRAYEGDIVVVQTARGFKLTCTPNHPVLTTRGWVSASLLRPGDDVVSDGSEIGAFAHVNNEHRIARIGEVFEAFRRARDVSTVEVKVAAPNFHGDGVGSEVAIVLSHGDLRQQTELLECFRLGKFGLVGRLRVARFLACAGASLKIVERAFASTHSSMCLFGDALAQAFVGSVGIQSGGTVTASRYVMSQQDSFYDRAVDSVNQGKSLLSHAVDVRPADVAFWKARDAQRVHAAHGAQLDKVVRIDSSFTRTHVFNLQTATGYYFADGIATHNCECGVELATGG